MIVSICGIIIGISTDITVNVLYIRLVRGTLRIQ